jgi:3-oxoacyl-[acyl-carrier protein] reductase
MPKGPFDLSGRTAIVTGAGSGIGRATANRLAAAGANVVCADLDEAAAGKVATGIAQGGGKARAHHVDVTSRESVDALVASVEDLAVMCNIAGVLRRAPVLDLTVEELRFLIEIDFFGVFHGAQAAARRMVERGGGSIINMSSSAIDSPAAGLAAYAVAKAGVAQLTRTMAIELGPSKVRVNAIAPGLVETAMTRAHFTDADGTIDEKARAQYLDRIIGATPLRMVGRPGDIACAVLYLACDASAYMTGQVLRPNGGTAMPG